MNGATMTNAFVRRSLFKARATVGGGGGKPALRVSKLSASNSQHSTTDDPVHDYRSLLIGNQEVLSRCIDLQHGLEVELLSKKVIAYNDFETIRTRVRNTRKVQVLLKLLSDRNDVNVYKRFLEVLLDSDTHHRHVYNYLNNVHGVDVDRPLSEDELGRLDRCFSNLVSGIYAGCDLLNELIARTCITLEHFAAIENHGTNQFERAKTLLDILRRRGFNAFINFVDVLRNMNQDHLADMLCTRACPAEVLELVLLAIAVNWDLKRWLRTRLVEPRTDIEIYATLCAVCSEWTDVVRSTRFRRLFRHFLNDRCYPYRRRVSRVRRLDLIEGVTGVAQLGDRLYVTVRDSDVVRVYDCSTSDYAELEPIRAKDLKNPWDMAACSLNSRIYITDCSMDGGGVCYIEILPTDVERSRTAGHFTPSHATGPPRSRTSCPLPSSDDNSHFVPDNYLNRNRRKGIQSVLGQGWLIRPGGIENPRGISVNPVTGHVTVVSWVDLGLSQLLIVDPLTADDAPSIDKRIIELPDVIDIPHHAIETPDGQFVVAHGRGEHTLHQICLVSSDGKILKSFGGTMSKTSSPRIRATEKADDDGRPSFNTEEKIDILTDEDVGPNVDDDGCDEYRRLNSPYALAIDRFLTSPVDGSATRTTAVDQQCMTIIIADYGGRRILVLDSQLQLTRTLLTNETDGIEEPRQVWIDSASGLLYVGQDTGFVDVFAVRCQRVN